MRRTPVMLMAALALVPVTIWTMSGSASAASGSLTVTTYSRTGAKVKTTLEVVNLATNANYSATSGKAKSLPKGTYAVMASIWTGQGSSHTLGARVLKVSGKTTTTIDARSGKALKVALDKSPGAAYVQELSARVCAKDYSVAAYNSAGHVFVIPNKSKHLRYGYAGEWHGDEPATAYVVAGGASSSIPSTQSHTFKKSALAPVTVSVRRGPSIGTHVQTELNSASSGCQGGLGGQVHSDAPPYNGKVYASAGTWTLEARSYAVEDNQHAGVGTFYKTLKLSAGKAVSQTFFRSAWGPAYNVPYVVSKRVHFNTDAMFTDPGFSWTGATGWEIGEKSTVTLSLGGKVLTKKSRTNWGSMDTAFFDYKLPKKGWYTLNIYAGRYRPGIKHPADLMSHQTNLWMNFYANPASDRQAPLILPRLAPLGLDLNNTARPGSTTAVTIMLDQQRLNPDASFGKATPKTVTTKASFDAGKTWKSVPVKKTGSTYQASVPNTKAGLVALRTKVVTTAGYSTEVTVYRAYRAG